jgi:hypothetical protein
MSPQKFTESRNYATMFAVVKLPEEIWLPEEKDASSTTLDSIPSELAEFGDVFSTEDSKTLPPHPPWDHSIDLSPHETPPFGPIYPLSQAELRELREYIDKTSPVDGSALLRVLREHPSSLSLRKMEPLGSAWIIVVSIK